MVNSKQEFITEFFHWDRPVFDTESAEVAMRCLQILGNDFQVDVHNKHYVIKVKLWGPYCPFYGFKELLDTLDLLSEKDVKVASQIRSKMHDFFSYLEKNLREGSVKCRAINDLMSVQKKEKEENIRYLTNLEEEVRSDHRRWR